MSYEQELLEQKQYIHETIVKGNAILKENQTKIDRHKTKIHDLTNENAWITKQVEQLGLIEAELKERIDLARGKPSE